MSKGQPIEKILNKKISRTNNSSSNIQLKESSPIKMIESINIKNSVFSFVDHKESNKKKILKIDKPVKSNIIKFIEKSNIKYTKCTYNSNKNFSIKCKKVLIIPKEVIKNNNKQKLFLRLINYKQKKIFILGYWNNILIYEIVNNDIFFVCSFFENKLNEPIGKIYLLKEDNLTNKIQLFIIVKNQGLIYEIDLKDYKLNVIKDNIILYQQDEYIINYRFNLINYNKLIIYNDNSSLIYNIEDNKFKKLDIINMEEYENINYIKKFTNDIFIINSDKKLYLYDSINDTLLFIIETELRFYWTKTLLLKNNQFLLYSSSDIYVYDFDYITKKDNGILNRKLSIKNIKDIYKIKQLSNEDLLINYRFNNILVYDMRKNIEKYRINNLPGIYSLIGDNHIIFEEIEPNIIIYNNNLYKINFFNAIKGETLGYFMEGNDITIKSLKKIKIHFIDAIYHQNNFSKIYFMITNKNAFILYK